MAIREKIDNAATSLKKNITSILLDIGIIGVALAYVFYNILEFNKTDLNPLRLLMKGAVGIFVGVGLKWMLGEKGLIKGYNSQQWIRPSTKYNNKAEKGIQYIDNFDEFKEKERTEKLFRNRKIRLNNYKMKYDTFFDKNGDYIEHEIWSPFKKKLFLHKHDFIPENVIILDLKQKLCLRKCIRLQIFVPNVFDEYGDTLTEDEKPEKTDRSVRSHNTRNNLVSAVIFALLGAYYVPDLLNFNWAEIIWSTFQVFMWLAFGIINFYQNYTFVVIDKVKQLSKKDKLLAKFLIGLLGREKYNELMREDDEYQITQEQFNKLIGATNQPEKTEIDIKPVSE